MRCIIVRHGKADASAGSGLDADRALTGHGRRQAKFLCRAFGAPDRRPALILASRFERAITTARLIQSALGAPLRVVGELEVGHPCSAAISLIARNLAASPLMLVGHNPQLSELVGALLRGLPPSESGLRTGEAVELELSPPELTGTAKELARFRLEGEG